MVLGKLPIVPKEFGDYYLKLMKNHQTMPTCHPVGLGNTRISTGGALKSFREKGMAPHRSTCAISDAGTVIIHRGH
jgi:hypothetical protein